MLANWLLALVYDRFMRPAEERGLHAWRAELLKGVSGRVLELGAGTGINLPLYPPGLERLVLTEPDRHMRRRLEDRLRAQGPAGAEVSPAPAQTLPFPPEAFDWVVCTLVLCTVPDPPAALAEVRRVLAPGGRLLFIEHVAGPEGSRLLAWQRCIEPFWRPLAGGCHLRRRSAEAISAGFELEACAREDMPGALFWVRPTVRGVARKRG